MADKTATFTVRVNAESNADKAALSVDQLRRQIEASQASVKAYEGAFRSLRGKTDEVTTAKTKFKAAAQAERDKISQATLALAKHGTTLSEAKQAVKGMSEETGGLKERFGALIGPAGIATAAVVGLTAAVVGGVKHLAEWIVESGDALRNMGLMREAALGSAKQAAAFGTQIEALGDKIPLTREELNKMSVDLSRALIGARVSGQGIVDIFNLVGQESAAMGDSAGKALESIVTRGKRVGSFGLNPQELQGTGLKFQEVAKNLAKDLGIGLKDAQARLILGRAGIDAGAKALRETVEQRFGAINADKMLSISAIKAKFFDRLQALVSGVNFKPILQALDGVSKFFDRSTVTGAALHDIITDIGSVLTKMFQVAAPFARKFFETLIIQTLKFEIVILRVALWLKQRFGVNFAKIFKDTSVAVTAAKIAFAAFGTAVVIAGVAIAGAMAGIYSTLKIFQFISDEFTKASDFLKNLTWFDIGKALVQGLANGMLAAVTLPIDAVKAIGRKIGDAFKNTLEIRSPSAVFERYGEQIGAGTEKGIRNSARAPAIASTAMAMSIRPTVGAPAAQRGRASGGGPVTVNVSLQFPNAKNGADVAEHLGSQSFRAQFVRLLEEAVIGMGLPAHAPAGQV